ncbi:MAG: CCA tRNA nucleotidyltransferase [Sporolactobacillus sp.]
MDFPFSGADKVIDRLLAHGYAAYVVGGAVRDFLIGRPVHDVDIATSAHPEEVTRLFKRTVPIGIAHGTVAVLEDGNSYEVTTFRSESSYEDFRHPNHVSFERSLDKDLMRRDFTINALAMDRSGCLIDHFGGAADLKAKRIRMVGKPQARIREDPLRMLRGLRFAAELGFEIGEGEQIAFIDSAPLLKKLSMERVDQEMTKLLAGKQAAHAIHMLFETGCARQLPFLDVPIKRPVLHLHFLNDNDERWSAFLECISLSLPQTAAFARAWKWPNARRKRVQLYRSALALCRVQDWNRLSVYTFSAAVAASAERLRAALGESTTDALKAIIETINRIDGRLPIHSSKELAVSGRDVLQWVGRPAGRWLAGELAAVEQAVITGQLENEKEAIAAWFQKRSV